VLHACFRTWKGKFHSAQSRACTIPTTNSWSQRAPSIQVSSETERFLTSVDVLNYFVVAHCRHSVATMMIGGI